MVGLLGSAAPQEGDTNAHLREDRAEGPLGGIFLAVSLSLTGILIASSVWRLSVRCYWKLFEARTASYAAFHCGTPQIILGI